MTQIISAIQSKGGAGKSALLNCLAGTLVKDGARVCLIDTDPQADSIEWAETTDEGTGFENLDVIAMLQEEKLEPLIEKLKPSYDVILIDTAGYDSRMATYVMSEVDLIFVPTNGSKKDIQGAAKTWKHINSVTKNHKSPPDVRIVFWKVNPRTNVYAHAKAALEKAGLPVLPGMVKLLTGFDNMTWNGGLPDGSAKQALDEFIYNLQKAELINFYNQNRAAA